MFSFGGALYVLSEMTEGGPHCSAHSRTGLWAHTMHILLALVLLPLHLAQKLLEFLRGSCSGIV